MTHMGLTSFGLFCFFFVFFFLVVLSLCCCAQAFSSCRERGLLSSRNAEACNCDHFLVDEHRL